MRQLAKLTALLCALVLLLSLCACGKQEIVQDNSPVTMYVGLGLTGGSYYSELHDAIYKSTGIDVQYVYSSTLDSSSAMLSRIQNNDLPADIIITSSVTPKAMQKLSFLDMAAYSDITDLFTTTKIQSIYVDGAVYQLPFSTRLIGVEYNRTLMKEMGWSLPNNFSEMLELKEKADEAGVLFAVSGAAAAGHGFNYLMHLCGSEFLSSPDGIEWFDEFLHGEASVDEFAGHAEYFKEYAEAGLFGEIHSSSLLAKDEFSRRRALFYYNIVNDAYSYDGFMYNGNGRICGADYSDYGVVKAEVSPDGEAVFCKGEFVLYDENNPEHRYLERYHIPGAVILHDEYGSMPWLSRDGSSSCFTAYDSMLIALNKNLSEPQNWYKREKAVKVLKFMVSDTAAKMFVDMHPDGYVSTHSFIIDDSRLYSDWVGSIQRGYLMPCYYNSFDNDSIVNVGQKVNDYLAGSEGVEFTDIIDELALRNRKFLSSGEEVACVLTETLDYENSARLQAISNGLSVQQSMDESGINGLVTVSILPYVDNISQLPIITSVGVVQEKLYAGNFLYSRIKSLINSGTAVPLAVCMTGAEIKALVESGFDLNNDYGVNRKFKYTCVVKSGIRLADNTEYIVALPEGCVEKTVFNDLNGRGKVFMSVMGSTERGLTDFFREHETLSPSDLIW